MGKTSGFMLILFAMAACNSDNPSIKTPSQYFATVIPDTSNQKSLAQFELHVQRRIEINDTVCIAHQRLEAVLTDTILGYKLEFDDANTFSSDLFTFSEANRVFYNDKEDYIELTIGDYVANPDFFRVNLQRYNLALGVEIGGVMDEKRMVTDFAPKQARDFFTWSSLNKRKHIAWAYIAIDERFFITIEATGQDDFLDLMIVKNWLKWDGLFENE